MATPSISLETGFLLTFIGMIGTTITPYMQFYLQSSIVDKKLSIKEYKYEKLDVYLGALWGNAVSFFIIVCTAAALYKANIRIESAQQAATALKPLAGEYAFILFGAGLFGASVLAAAVIPLSTSYAICEAFGWESGVDNEYREAPAFFGIYTAIIAVSSLLILIPGLSLMKIILVTQQVAGILSPIILAFMIVLVNDKNIMGKYTNTRLQNFVSITTVVFIVALSLVLFVSPLFS
jgi:Mn2+/Fe2+ NRAMP family transporter